MKRLFAALAVIGVMLPSTAHAQSADVFTQARALVCQWSAADCAAIRNLPIGYGAQVVMASGPAVSTTWWQANGQAQQITINPELTSAPTIAASIVHEADNIRAGWHQDCGDYTYQAFVEQSHFMQWYVDSLQPNAFMKLPPDWDVVVNSSAYGLFVGWPCS